MIHASILTALLLLTACKRPFYPGDKDLDASGRTPLMAAAMEGNAADVRKALDDHCDIERTWQERTPLGWAVMYKHDDTVDVLLEAGAKCGSAGRSGQTVLSVACEVGATAIAKKLIARGVRPTGSAYDKRLLELSARNDEPELIDAVMALGFKVDRADTDDFGRTALHVAGACGCDRVVKRLVELGAELNARTAQGWTPLHLACGSDYPSTVRLLVTLGADVNARDAKGRTPLHVAAELGSAGAIETLNDSNWKSFREQEAALDMHGRAPLHLAAWSGHRKCARLVWSDQVLTTQHLKWSPAHTAALAGDIELTRFLMSRSESVGTDCIGRTPLDFLAADIENLGRKTPPESAVPQTFDLHVGKDVVKRVRWSFDAGYSIDFCAGGARFVLWSDGVYVRGDPCQTGTYFVGRLNSDQQVALLSGIEETGVWDQESWSHLAVDASSDSLVLHADATRPARQFTSSGLGYYPERAASLERRLETLELERALRLIELTRGDVEEQLSRHLVDGEFRGIKPP